MDYMRSVLFQRIHRVSVLENAGVGTSIEAHAQANCHQRGDVIGRKVVIGDGRICNLPDFFWTTYACSCSM